jgi:LPXTG-motif cell wall-anchored protein
MTDLTPEQKDDFKKQIDEAKTTEEVDAIVDEADKQNEKNKSDREARETQELKDKKTDAKNQIDGMTDLTPEQKDDFKKQIDEAKTTEEVDAIVDEADKQNELPRTGSTDTNNLTIMGIISMIITLLLGLFWIPGNAT